MKVRIQENGPFNGYDVFVVSDDFQYIYILDNQGWHWTRCVPDNQKQEPSLRIQEDILRAILLEAGKVIPATHATERHLQREIEISNRLLNLVEDAFSE